MAIQKNGLVLPVARIVYLGQGVGNVLEGRNCDDWSKHLLLYDIHVLTNEGQI